MRRRWCGAPGGRPALSIASACTQTACAEEAKACLAGQNEEAGRLGVRRRSGEILGDPNDAAVVDADAHVRDGRAPGRRRRSWGPARRAAAREPGGATIVSAYVTTAGPLPISAPAAKLAAVSVAAKAWFITHRTAPGIAQSATARSISRARCRPRR
jgi:hypothetical protein